MKIIKHVIIASVIGVLGQSLQGAQQSESEAKKAGELGQAEAKKAGEKRTYNQLQREALKFWVPFIEAENDNWEKQKELIKGLIIQNNIHPDDIELNFLKNTAELVVMRASNPDLAEYHLSKQDSPLAKAIAVEDASFTRFLLQKGADPNKEFGGVSYTHPLFSARNARVAQALLDFGSDINVKEYNSTLLNYHSLPGNPKLALIYFRNGINMASASQALREFILCGDEDCHSLVQIFVKMGTALNWAEIKGGHSDQKIARRERNIEVAEAAKQEVDKAQVDRALGLLPLLQQCGHFYSGPAKIIHSYENLEDHILPLSLVREMEELDKELEAEVQKEQATK